MTTCHFCFQGYLGGLPFHAGVPAPKPRQAAARNEYGDAACERHVDRLWAATAARKGMEK